jgi:hypothetical protein
MNITFGGIGVAIVTHKTDFEIEMGLFGDCLKSFASQLDTVQKLHVGDLRKTVNPATLVSELAKLKALMQEATKIADRRDAAFADFKLWATDAQYRPPKTGVAEKHLDGSAESAARRRLFDPGIGR